MLQHTGWIDHSQVRRGSCEAITILHPVDVKRPTITLLHVITVYNDMFDQLDVVMPALAKKLTPSKEDLYFAAKLVRQQLSKHYAEVTHPTGMLLILSPSLHCFRKSRLFSELETGMDIDPVDQI